MKYFRIKDAAKKIGVTRQAIYLNIWLGRINAEKIGDYLLIREDELRQLKLASRKNRMMIIRKNKGVSYEYERKT